LLSIHGGTIARIGRIQPEPKSFQPALDRGDPSIARLSLLLSLLQNALWAVPMALVAAAVVSAAVAVNIQIEPGDDPVWWLYSGDADTASGFLANLLTAMITLATLAISITMVVLTLAAQSLGPRLIPLFMADTRTKLALGLFIGTVAYLLIVLRSVVGLSDRAPNLAISIGTLLVLISVVVLLLFVHHLARSIVANTIVERVGETLDATARALLPKTDASSGAPMPDGEASGASFSTAAGGYIQAIEHDAIVTAASKADGTVTLRFRPGHFVLKAEALGGVSPPQALDDALRATLTDAIVLGAEPTSSQDIEYAIRQLVEIALRALSTGVNDPSTAQAVIDRMAASLALIVELGAPRTTWADGDGVARLVVPATDFRGILDAAFNQIRQAGATQPAILIQLIARLGQLLAHAGPSQAKAIVAHIELVRQTGRRGIADEADRDALEERIAEALQPRTG
jgi:uncharacterized membrane protein